MAIHTNNENTKTKANAKPVIDHLTCEDLRAIARGWKGTRKEFIDHMAAIGANPHTATTQWHQARREDATKH